MLHWISNHVCHHTFLDFQGEEESKEGVVVPFHAQILTNFTHHVHYKQLKLKIYTQETQKNATNGDGGV